MVDRRLGMAEAPGSNPGGSIYKHVIVCLIGAAYILTDDK